MVLSFSSSTNSTHGPVPGVSEASNSVLPLLSLTAGSAPWSKSHFHALHVPQAGCETKRRRTAPIPPQPLVLKRHLGDICTVRQQQFHTVHPSKHSQPRAIAVDCGILAPAWRSRRSMFRLPFAAAVPRAGKSAPHIPSPFGSAPVRRSTLTLSSPASPLSPAAQTRSVSP